MTLRFSFFFVALLTLTACGDPDPRSGDAALEADSPQTDVLIQPDAGEDASHDTGRPDSAVINDGGENDSAVLADAPLDRGLDLGSAFEQSCLGTASCEFIAEDQCAATAGCSASGLGGRCTDPAIKRPASTCMRFGDARDCTSAGCLWLGTCALDDGVSCETSAPESCAQLGCQLTCEVSAHCTADGAVCIDGRCAQL